MLSPVIFFGDSITAGGKTDTDRIGQGFVSMIAQRFSDNPGGIQTSIMNAGVNGNTVQDLLGRHDADVVRHDPELIVIEIGINDAYNDHMSGNHPNNLNCFEQDYRKLLADIRRKLPGSQIILLTPYYISDTNKDPLYQRMAEYIEVVFTLSQEFNLALCDIQSVFDAAVQVKPADQWASDHIHPVIDGHALIARHVHEQILKCVDH